MPIVGGLDIHRKQITFDYLDTVTGQVHRGQVAPADRAHLRAWLARFSGRDDVAFAVEAAPGYLRATYRLRAAVRGGSCMPLYALATAVRRPRRCRRRTALTVITTAASTASITQVRIRSPVSARWNPVPE